MTPRCIYVAVALENIKIDEVDTQGNTKNGVTKHYARSSIISLSDFFKKSTLLTKKLKYSPDKFLSDAQLNLKKTSNKGN